MTHGGSALGRYDGRAIFVPYALPGETIRARITQDKGNFAHAEVIELIESSPHRITPPCSHFGVCGGCHWQHIAYPTQLEYKRQIVIDQFKRIAGITDAEARVLPTIASPESFAYRTHITLHHTPDGQPGFIGTDDRTVVPISQCHIIRPELQAMLTPTTADAARLRLQVGTDGHSEDSAGFVWYTLRDKLFRCAAGSFFQVNLMQAETLIDLVLHYANLSGTERVADLYAGVGLFTAFLADQAKRVLHLESATSAVRDAKVNLKTYKTIDYHTGEVEQVLPKLAQNHKRFEVVVLDPPRSGMKPKALEALIKTQPHTIVYVSCDPATLARDAKGLLKAGYQFVEVQPVDMFPQTYHIECVAKFTAKAR